MCCPLWVGAVDLMSARLLKNNNHLCMLILLCVGIRKIVHVAFGPLSWWGGINGTTPPSWRIANRPFEKRRSYCLTPKLHDARTMGGKSFDGGWGCVEGAVSKCRDVRSVCLVKVFDWWGGRCGLERSLDAPKVFGGSIESIWRCGKAFSTIN